MRKSVLFTMMLLPALLLGACGSTGSTSSASAGQSDVMAPALELAAKTLRLEGTNQAIDAEMAAQLLPLWQLMDELSTNGSTAPQEVTAVIEQIDTTMTPQQVKAIDDMNLTQEDLLASRTRNSTRDSTNSNTAGSAGGNTNMVGALAGDGGPPAGGFPGGDPGAGGPGSGANVQRNTSSSQASNTSGTASLIEQVINLLESKVQN